MAGEHLQILSAGVLITYALVVAFRLFFRSTFIPENVIGGALLIAAILLSAAACIAAWRANVAHARAWLVFGLSALASLFNPIISIALFGTAALLLVRQQEKSPWEELLFDVALVGSAATAVLHRWLPDLAVGDVAVAAIIAVVAAALLLVLAAGNGVLPRIAAYALAGAAGCVLVAVWSRYQGAVANEATARLGVWLFVMFAAVVAIRNGVVVQAAPNPIRLREWAGPVAIVALGAVAVHAVLSPPLGESVAYAVAALTVLTTLRMLQLLRATRGLVSEQRELAQMRALIEVNRALAGTNDLDSTLRTVTDWARRVLHANSAVIEMLTPDGQQLVLRAATGLPADVVGITYAVDKSFTGSVVKTREVRLSTNAAKDPMFSPQSSFLGEQAVAAVPLRFRERILGVLACMRSKPFEPPDVELLYAFANQAALAIEDARLFEQVRTLSVTDSLTGLANRRRLDRELAREFAAARRGRKLVAVMFDLDDFKQHNDRFGHLAGDRALKHFADALKTETRAMNLAARFGGDEFFVLLGDADRQGAEVFIERIKNRFARTMRESGNPVLTVSAGIAEFQPDMSTADELIEAADRALYSAKSEGGTSK